MPRSGEDAILFAAVAVAASCVVFGRFSTLLILFLGELPISSHSLHSLKAAEAAGTALAGLQAHGN